MAVDVAIAAPRQERSDPIEAEAPRRSRRWEIYFLAILMTYVYVLVGWWLKYRYHFSVNDAISRTNDAKAMILSRDPHAAAIGVYWMPFPTVFQIPFVAILEPLRRVEFAGPASTALLSGGTLVVLGKLGRDLGLSRVTTFLITAAYAINPVILYYAANGMAEAAEFFFIAVALWGLLRFLRDSRNSSAVIGAAGLTGLAMSKYEALPIVLLVAVVILFLHLRKLPRGDWHQTALDASIIVLPAVFFVAAWLIYQKFILGSFFAFAHVGIGTAHAAGARPEVRSVVGSASRTAAFVVKWILFFFPAAALLVPALLLPPWRRMLGGFAIAATGILSVLMTAYYIYRGHSVGEPRYFTPMIIIGTIAVMAVAARLPRPSLSRWLVDPFAIFLVLVAGYSGGVAEAANKTSVEGEARVFQLVNGLYDAHADPNTDHSTQYRQAAARLDSMLQPGDRVFIDERYDNGVVLDSYKPKQIVTNSDRDYEQLASPTGIEARIGWAVVPKVIPGEGIDATASDSYQLVHRQPGWQRVWRNGWVEIWKRDPAQLKSLPMPPRG